MKFNEESTRMFMGFNLKELDVNFASPCEEGNVKSFICQTLVHTKYIFR